MNPIRGVLLAAAAVVVLAVAAPIASAHDLSPHERPASMSTKERLAFNLRRLHHARTAKRWIRRFQRRHGRSIAALNRDWVAHVRLERAARREIVRLRRQLRRAPRVQFGIWDALARCETAGNWGAKGPTFQGGLGIYYGTWLAYRLHGYPSNAGYATREQQIAVARRILARHGPSAWGCGPRVGLYRGA